MVDICIVYAHPSKPIARALHDVLCRRYSVWWDEDIHSGDYRTVIETQLSQAKCVIPLWCRVARADADVIDEANFARKHQVPLLPVRLEAVDPPLGFASLHTVDLLGWDGKHAHAGIEELLLNVEKLLGSRPPRLKRATELLVHGRKLDLPAFFFSVSSHETGLAPAAALSALSLFGVPALLVSAYDLFHEKDTAEIRTYLTKCRSAGAVVLLDSGNYEAYRKDDKLWGPEGLAHAAGSKQYDFAFCFDAVDPPSDVPALIRGVLQAVHRDSQNTGGPVLPIVHAPRDASTGASRYEILPEALQCIARELRPDLLAVPERELGDGLLARARTVYKIRCRLDELGFYQRLHLLGTGNPLSVAVLAAVGADSFDGLEWCRTVADHESGRLFHLHQYDFFAWQSRMAESPIVTEAVAAKGINLPGKVAFHNLEFFSRWMEELRNHILSGKVERFLTEKLPWGTQDMKLLENAVPEVFR